ncbi:MAG TPA: acetylxylan esterase [Lacunisphaera sp.]|nr:acetylxylan esterase [Lacunisphaera sp.]
MSVSISHWVVAYLLLSVGVTLRGSAATEPLPPVLAARENGVAPADQMQAYLQGEIDTAWERWKAAYEKRTDPDAITAYYAGLKQKMTAAIGGFPARTPLNGRVTGTLHREGYRVDKVIFESQPGIFVTAALFLPDAAPFVPPYPGVLVPCGHYGPGKAHDEYQSVGALLALNGMAALVFDPLDQGERHQSLDDKGQPRFWGTEAHTRLAIRASLLGLSAAQFEIWDGMRAIDYLQSRPEIDPARIGCTGNSGGGTQTAYLMALDDRIQAAAPSCYITHLASQTRVATGDGEQHIYGQVAFGLDHPDYLMMRAPLPIKLLDATHDFFAIDATWETYRLALRAYTRFGASDRMAILENDAGHNYNRTQREAAVQWLALWLLGRNAEVHEPDLHLFTADEMRCTPRGEALLLTGARSVQALLATDEDRLAEQRRETWTGMTPAQRRDAVRHTARFAAADHLPARTWNRAWSQRRDGYQVDAYRIIVPGGLVLPAVWFKPDRPADGPPVVFAAEEGFQASTAPGARLDELARSGHSVLAIDLRGTGATKQSNQSGLSEAIGSDWKDMCRAYVLGRPYVGMQAEDLLDAVRQAQAWTHATAVDLITTGEIGVAALHAAFSEPDRFHHVTIEHSLRSWDEVVRAPRFYHQFMNAVPGALRTYDLPDLAQVLGDRVTVVDGTDALGWSEKENGVAPDPADVSPDRGGLAGVIYGSPNFTNPQAGNLLSAGAMEWAEGKLNPGRDWAVRWQGFLRADITGTISFDVDSTERAVLRIAGQPVTSEIRCEAGRPFLLELDLVRPGTDSANPDRTTRLRLCWRRDGGEWQTVPAAWLCHSRQQEVEVARLFR